jgi:hypothetical protein
VRRGPRFHHDASCFSRCDGCHRRPSCRARPYYRQPSEPGAVGAAGPGQRGARGRRYLFGAGLVLNAILGAGQPIAEWQTNVGGAVIVLLGTLATGTVAGARTAREWVQAAILTFAGLLGIAVVVFVYAVGMEPPR